ncbi:MAG TPA: rhodanese-like domain-containing protein [Candidatus Nitrosotenuis sp.]|jgi:rhodanese-related sulfurtransferase|nr:rhodanese-like domain-containing protein [Candidatus Nitrosotenuis sp.]
MDPVWILVGALALGLAWTALRLGEVRSRLDTLSARLDEQRSALRGEVKEELGVLRLHLAALAQGARLTPEMVREGSLWTDATWEQVAEMLRQDPRTLVLDVRSPEERLARRIPGSRHIPVEQVVERRAEIPRDVPVVVHCAGGGRSASACHLLAQEGYFNLVNMVGGINAWQGPLESGPEG